MASSRPGSTARAAGAVTCASTLPAATAIPAGRPVQPGGPLRQRPGAGSEFGQLARGRQQPGGREVREPRVQRGQELLRRIRAVLVDPLVPGRAGVPGLLAGELPHDPVRGLDPPLAVPIDLRRLLQHLQSLGELPLRGLLPAVPADPRLAALHRQGVDPVGLPLAGVVLPQLGPGMRPAGQAVGLAQRRAVGQRRQHRARGEVRRDPDHLGRVHPGRGQRRRNRQAQHVAPVLRVLQSPVRRQRTGPVRQRPLDHAVPVLVDRAPQFGTVRDPHDDGPPGQRPEVDTDREPGRSGGVHPVIGRCVSGNTHGCQRFLARPLRAAEIGWSVGRARWDGRCGRTVRNRRCGDSMRCHAVPCGAVCVVRCGAYNAVRCKYGAGAGRPGRRAARPDAPPTGWAARRCAARPARWGSLSGPEPRAGCRRSAPAGG